MSTINGMMKCISVTMALAVLRNAMFFLFEILCSLTIIYELRPHLYVVREGGAALDADPNSLLGVLPIWNVNVPPRTRSPCLNHALL